jgi:hypothetical protein
VFTEVALGAVILTINVILLGGSIVFFQSLCLIGYCLFPIVIAAIVCTLVSLSVSGGRLTGQLEHRGSGMTNTSSSSYSCVAVATYHCMQVCRS